MEWISVKDRLPKLGITVIVAGGVASYEGNGIWLSQTGASHDLIITWPVTHWMPLPEPPHKTGG